MSFLKRLFGGSQDKPEESRGTPVDYNGFTIVPAPFKEGGQYQVCGIITKSVGGTPLEHKFIRADRFPGYDDAVETTMRKARQLVDEQGDRMFST